MKPGENPPVGLVLCTSKDSNEAHYALEGLPNKVMAAEYQTVLPYAKLLEAELDKTRRELEARRVRRVDAEGGESSASTASVGVCLQSHPSRVCRPAPGRSTAYARETSSTAGCLLSKAPTGSWPGPKPSPPRSLRWPALLRMREMRQRGYRAMGYGMGIDATGGDDGVSPRDLGKPAPATELPRQRAFVP